MMFGKHDHQGLADDWFHGQRAVVCGEPQKAGMDLPVAQQLELLARPQELKRELDGRVTLAEHRQQAREDIQLRGRHVSDDQLPGLPTGRPARDLRRTVRLGERQPRFDKEGSAGVRQLDSTARPMEEADAEFMLEATNLLTERRLRDVKAPGSSTEVQFFRHRDEIAEVPKFHG
jgi:hypothetical protein